MSDTIIDIDKKLKRLSQKKVFGFLVLSDVVMFALSFVLSFLFVSYVEESFLYYFDSESADKYKSVIDYSFLAICPVLIAIFYLKGHYTQRVPWWVQARYLFLVFLTMVVANGFLYLIIDAEIADFLMISVWMFTFLFILLGRQIVYRILNFLGCWRVDTIVIGGIDSVTDMLYAFNADGYTGYDVKTIVVRDRKDREFDVDSVPRQYANVNVVRDESDYEEFIKSNCDNFFIISLDTFRGEERDNLIHELTDRHILYSVVPPTSSMSLSEMKPQNFFGSDIMMLHSKNNIYSILGRFLKRTKDIVASCLALILISPVVLIVAASLKLEGQGGSVFYGGERIGRGGKKFKCWKFRSMEPDSDHLLEELIESDAEIKENWLKYRKLKVADPRITTKTAHIIRKASIDELPQLWNVFIGDMSLVGPRPILENEIELMEGSYKNYVKVRPGITGLWQVSGRNDTSFARRVYMDNWYIRNWSIWGDIVILIKTLNVVLRGSGSY